MARDSVGPVCGMLITAYFTFDHQARLITDFQVLYDLSVLSKGSVGRGRGGVCQGGRMQWYKHNKQCTVLQAAQQDVTKKKLSLPSA